MCIRIGLLQWKCILWRRYVHVRMCNALILIEYGDGLITQQVVRDSSSRALVADTETRHWFFERDSRRVLILQGVRTCRLVISGVV